MIAHGVDREANDLAVALREFRFGLGEIAELGGADRREILGVREKHSPRVTDPLMEVDTSLGGVGREIGSAITYSERHDILLCLGIAAIAKWGHVNHCERPPPGAESGRPRASYEIRLDDLPALAPRRPGPR